mmetsp:Transcript_19794/g.55654  ORF Transcript_19794/g.55654 Transcript_19794/m.55654 type:complete len:628 (-) Transcript_19794:177-2060(-)
MRDLTLKPSLGSYTLRPDRRTHTPSVEQAQDADESLIAVIDLQINVALRKVQMGESRQAINVLRRAHRLATERLASSAPGVETPAAKFALATVHLQMCTVLSRTGRHPQAAEEAAAAQHQMDQLWKSMLEAAAEAEIATAEGDPTRPAEPLRKLLRRPPPWLERAVEVSIQARQCLALEMEFEIRPAPRKPGAPSLPASPTSVGIELDDDPGTPSPAGVEAEPGSPKPPKTPRETMEGLHEEAVLLARQLLPAEHPVRARAEQVQKDMQSRQEMKRARYLARTKSAPCSCFADGDGWLDKSDNLEDLLREDALQADDELTILPSEAPSEFPKLLRSLPPKQPSATSPTATSKVLLSTPSTDVGGEGSSATPASMGISWSSSALPGPSASHGGLFAPRGDVLSTSLPRSQSTTRLKKRRQNTSFSKTAASLLAPAEERDPFKDWKKSMMDINKMSLVQLKTRSDEGLKDLQFSLKLEQRKFKQITLNDMDDDRLYDNRVIYSDHGLHVAQKSQARLSDWKKEAWTPTQAQQERLSHERELFTYYKVKVPEAGPGMKHLRILMQESFERTPMEKSRKKREEEMRRQREDQERREEQDRLKEDAQAQLQSVGGKFKDTLKLRGSPLQQTT